MFTLNADGFEPMRVRVPHITQIVKRTALFYGDLAKRSNYGRHHLDRLPLVQRGRTAAEGDHVLALHPHAQVFILRLDGADGAGPFGHGRRASEGEAHAG